MEKKRQHYVPKFYLRCFSKNDKLINAYHLKSNKILENISLKRQCSEDYFYSKDVTIEDDLSRWENEAGQLIHQIKKENDLPKMFSLEHRTICKYIVLQYLRTASAKSSMENVFNEFLRTFIKNDPELSHIDNPNDFFLKDEEISLRLLERTRHDKIILDLKMKLLINQTNRDFCISDSPLVKCNPYFENVNVGFQERGIIIFFPISSNKVIMLYDSLIYNTHIV